MSREFSRSLRVAEQIQRELAQLIQTEVKDPRVGMVSISEVRVSNDLAHAKVFMTVIGSDAEGAAESVGILNRAAPFLRHALGRRMVLRIVPQLHFVYDETLETGARLAALIDASVAGGGKKGENES
jgi:ribosome-binding factor A